MITSARSIATLCVLLFSACCSTRPVVPGKFAVLPESEAMSIVQQCSRSAPAIDGTWTVTPDDIVQLERDLPKLRRMHSTGCCFAGGRIDDLDSYLRQYVGVIVQGRRYIYINAFAEGPGDIESPDWRDAAVKGCDGGTGFWGALYDPATRQFSDLAINGLA